MSYMQEYEKWLASPALSEQEHAELESIRDDEKEIRERFYGPLEFGTAGLRGTMKVGLHQMNIHVIRWATQGFANVICAEGEEAKRRGVALCMDCRNHSMEFARAAAEVCAANGIHVRIFESLRPTPELSFAVREYDCQAGINVTASHNPKEYNGYKVYWSDGAQLPPQHAAAIARELEQIDIFTGIRRMEFDDAKAQGLIEIMGAETDERFMSHVMAMVNDRESMAKVADTFHMVYTPFHGCGWKLVPEALRGLGVKHLHCVPEQMVLDGSFPTVVSPNPENPEGFYLAIQLADKVGADFILGTDPDSDRVGIAVNQGGEFKLMTGNEVGILLLDFIARVKQEQGKLPAHPVAVTTIVSTDMVDPIAQHYGIEMRRCLTGFKYIGDIIADVEQKEGSYESFLLGFEESYGYLSGGYVRDKDAVDGSMLICEMASYYKRQGKTLVDAMNDLYETYGYYQNATLNFGFEGEDGMKTMQKIMDTLRSDPPAEIAGTKVIGRSDYEASQSYGDKEGAIDLPKSNVLEYRLENGCKLIVRPSGTEPKIKIYLSGKGATMEESLAEIEKMKAAAPGLLGQ